MAEVQHTLWADDRPFHITWLSPPFMPPLASTTQVYAICFTAEGQIVLISLDDGQWNLPGGTIEPGETLPQTLKRELWEEACAEVVVYTYIGCQRVDDLENPLGPQTYYQTRFWARVTLQPFLPQFETVARTLIPPDQFLTTLVWGAAPTARVILEAGLIEERRFAAGTS
jgi:8-oxo-dGTP pyrophosphatase MutT (NUDIX family)